MTSIGRLGLSRIPFTREFDHCDHVKWPFINDEVDRLLRTVKSRMSAALIAPAGNGKTVALRTLAKKLPEASYHVSYIKVTSLSRRDMCREIAAAIGAKSAGTYPSLVRSVQQRLDTELGNEGRRPVLLIDEAHDMRPETLAMLRILTNFDMDSRLVVSLVLVGQPTLKTMLAMPELSEISSRLNHCGEIRLLTREESYRYLDHRCRSAGASGNLFDEDAVEGVFEITRGNMRAIDRLALEAIYELAEMGGDKVTPEIVVKVRARLWI